MTFTAQHFSGHTTILTLHITYNNVSSNQFVPNEKWQKLRSNVCTTYYRVCVQHYYMFIQLTIKYSWSNALPHRWSQNQKTSAPTIKDEISVETPKCYKWLGISLIPDKLKVRGRTKNSEIHKIVIVHKNEQNVLICIP